MSNRFRADKGEWVECAFWRSVQVLEGNFDRYPEDEFAKEDLEGRLCSTSAPKAPNNNTRWN